MDYLGAWALALPLFVQGCLIIALQGDSLKSVHIFYSPEGKILLFRARA